MRAFVAIGDSFTEGLDDPAAGGGHRGWADRVAERLGREDPEFRYANLAVRGRLLGAVVEEQLPAALALRPTLVSIAAGTNDALRRSFEPEPLGRLLCDAARAVTAAGAVPLLFTGTDPRVRLPFARRLLPRIEAINAAAREAAWETGGLLVDLWPERLFDDPRLWSEDRLHLGPVGHARVADAVLEALGHAVGDWRRPLEPAPPLSWQRARRADLRWAGRHLAPWVGRRLRGRSSGDLVQPKRPRLEALSAPRPLDQPAAGRPVEPSSPSR